MKLTKFGVALAAMALCCAGAQAATISFGHVTDGLFTSPGEWAGSTVSKQFFPVVGQSGGTYLYVDQSNRQNVNQTGGVSPAVVAFNSPNTLFLMYDWVNGPSGPNGTNPFNGSSFFDVFFQVNSPVNPADYLVRIFPGSNNFQGYERTPGLPAPVNADGSFDVGPGSGWAALDAGDLARARFRTAIGFGTSPDDATNHPMAEFELSIDNTAPSRGGAQGEPGLYDPAPAFWSASATVEVDPPISSGIFVLNPNGTTTVIPVLGPNGGPISQPIQPLATVPEPSTLMLVGLGLMAFLRARKGRKASGERVRSA